MVFLLLQNRKKVQKMKKSDYIAIANKLMTLATNKNNMFLYHFDDREKELIRQLIRKCNEVEIYEICEIDGSDRRVESKEKGKFSFQRG